MNSPAQLDPSSGVDRWEDFVDKTADYPNTVAFHPTYLFRGQANAAWTLEPSFTRIAKKRGLTREQALQLEREAVNEFAISASKLLPVEQTIRLTLAAFKSGNPRPLDFGGWFVVMQHYGAPTRMLDWTRSPWVALYFACCEEGESDGVLWIADYAKVTKYSKKKMPHESVFSYMTKAGAPSVLSFTTPLNTNERIEAQQARSSICTDPLADHLDELKRADAVERLTVSREFKPTALIKLRQMNMSAKTLFPGIEGLGRSMAEYCRLWDAESIIE